MGTNIQTFCNFLTTSDVMKILKIGNKACLELFYRKDFPCERVGKSYLIRFLKKILKNISKQEECLKKKMISNKNEDLNIRHLNLQ